MAQIDLSTLTPEQIVPGISARPSNRGVQQQNDPYAGFSDVPPVQAQQPAQSPQGDPYAAFSDAPPQRGTVTRQIPKTESAARGALDMMTFGLAPSIAGLANASGIPSEAKGDDQVDINPIRPLVGAAKLIGNAFSDHPDKAVREAYEAGRQSMLDQNKAASEQNPLSYIGGQVGGGLISLPLGAAGAAETAGARVLQATKMGGIGGGLYGGGSSISEGNDPLTVAKDAGLGTLTGAAFGTGTGAGIEAVKGIGRGVASIARGHVNPESEAARRVSSALRSDFENSGPKFTPATARGVQETGAPVSVMDLGGERTRALARSAANTSPEARQALTEATQPRFEQQASRISRFIRSLTGGADASDDLLKIEQAARKSNRPLYARAYAVGNKPIGSPELDRLSQSPAIQSAIRSAEKRGANRAIEEGQRSFDPNNKNLQFWDYVQRELGDAAKKAERAGGYDEARNLKGLHRQLRDELDKIVPEFGKARQSAATFFGAENALEAGQKFVMTNSNLSEARRAIAKMSGPERELFARGFASELADKIERTGDNRNVLNSIFLNNGPARQKVELALGRDRARRLEAALRAETLLNEARSAVSGNSTTARQIAEMNSAGGNAGEMFAIVQESGGKAGLAIALAKKLIYGAKNKIDGKVAQRVGEILASDDPAVFQRGVNLISSRPAIFDALRSATGNAVQRGVGSGSVVGAQDVGPARAASAVGAGMSSLFEKPERHQEEHDSSQ